MTERPGDHAIQQSYQPSCIEAAQVLYSDHYSARTENHHPVTGMALEQVEKYS